MDKTSNGEAVTVDDGTEIELTMTVKVKRYIPAKGKGRIMMAHGLSWSSEDVRGSVYAGPMGSADTVITVRRNDQMAKEEHFTFDAQSMIDSAIEAFRS